MTTQTKEIMQKLNHIQGDLDFIKKRLLDEDLILDEDDIESIHKAHEDIKTGKTKRIA